METTEIRDRRIMLKIKIKSLVAESRLIKNYENEKRYGFLRDELHNHRVVDVRKQARSTYIAYGLIRGKKYAVIESRVKTKPDWKRVEAMLRKYGPSNAVMLLPTIDENILRPSVQEQIIKPEKVVQQTV